VRDNADPKNVAGMWALTSLAVTAAAPCEDGGPWACLEDGCPATRSANCEFLKASCEKQWSQVWKQLPPGVDPSGAVWQSCPQTCGRCDGGAGGGASKCVSWRQTAGCSPSGRRESGMDQGCATVIENGWSGYCECEGGVRTAEHSCTHDPFLCEAKCVEQWAWLREQRLKRTAAEGDIGEASADDNLAKLYKRGKGFYVMGNTELALRHFREALKLDPEHPACFGEEIKPCPVSACTRYCFASKLGVHYPFIAPPPLAKPTLLQYCCTTIAQYTPVHGPPFSMPYTIQ